MVTISSNILQQLQNCYSSSSAVVVPIILILLSLLLICSKSANSKKINNSPPCLPKLPIIGNIHQLSFYLHRSLWTLAKHHGHELMFIHLGPLPMLIVSSAKVSSEIMKFPQRPITKTCAKLFYDGKDVAMAQYGEQWRLMRGICVHHLLSSSRVRSFRLVMQQEMDLLVERITTTSNLQKNSTSTSIDLGNILGTFTKDVICRVALGRKYDADLTNLISGLSKLVGQFRAGDFIPWLAWTNKLDGWDAKVNKVHNGFDRFLEEVLQEHEQHHRHCANQDPFIEDDQARDLVDVLLDVQNNHTDGGSIHRDNIKALIMDMFLGGTDTTSTMLEWTMSELLKNPTIMQQVQKEVRGICGNKSTVDEDDVKQMKYLKAVIKETLRLHPPVPLASRISLEDAEINGYDIPAGTSVLVNIWAIQRDPASWEEPEKFDPNRFLMSSSSSIDFIGKDSEFIPFGAERRICPGISFAVVTTEFVVANLMLKIDWELPDRAEPETLDMTERIGVMNRKNIPLIAVAKAIVNFI